MTEAEWLAATDPHAMPTFLCFGLKLSRTKAGRRKLRLYACACGRRVWAFLKDKQSKRAIELAERFAEGLASTTELERMWNEVRGHALCGAVCGPISSAAAQTPSQAVAVVAWAAEEKQKGAYDAVFKDESSAQADLVRDIFGNPFRPVSFSPEWRTSTAVALARQMYESRDFGAMPILADALQDAGCDSEEVLNHCRGPGPHVRGCWVVDLVLGKS